jgi:intracellular protein transport protein USO1
MTRFSLVFVCVLLCADNVAAQGLLGKFLKRSIKVNDSESEDHMCMDSASFASLSDQLETEVFEKQAALAAREEALKELTMLQDQLKQLQSESIEKYDDLQEATDKADDLEGWHPLYARKLANAQKKAADDLARIEQLVIEKEAELQQATQKYADDSKTQTNDFESRLAETEKKWRYELEKINKSHAQKLDLAQQSCNADADPDSLAKQHQTKLSEMIDSLSEEQTKVKQLEDKLASLQSDKESMSSKLKELHDKHTKTVSTHEQEVKQREKEIADLQQQSEKQVQEVEERWKKIMEEKEKEWTEKHESLEKEHKHRFHLFRQESQKSLQETLDKQVEEKNRELAKLQDEHKQKMAAMQENLDKLHGKLNSTSKESSEHRDRLKDLQMMHEQESKVSVQFAVSRVCGTLNYGANWRVPCSVLNAGTVRFAP